MHLYTYPHQHMYTKGVWVMSAPRFCSLGSFVEFKDRLFLSKKLSLFLFAILALFCVFISLKCMIKFKCFVAIQASKIMRNVKESAPWTVLENHKLRHCHNERSGLI